MKSKPSNDTGLHWCFDGWALYVEYARCLDEDWGDRAKAAWDAYQQHRNTCQECKRGPNDGKQS